MTPTSEEYIGEEATVGGEGDSGARAVRKGDDAQRPPRGNDPEAAQGGAHAGAGGGGGGEQTEVTYLRGL
eukprot:7616294-Pyramimonas_sp.AAC.1